MSQSEILWAPRVPKDFIQRLYEEDALGFVDDELADEVGWRLFARCQSFIQAVEAVSGKVKCPFCQGVINHSNNRDEIIHCSDCDWETTWGAYFATIQHKQLSGGEAVVKFFQEFTRGFPDAQTYQQKMLLIDRLIHGFHIYFKDESPTRTTAVNLIEGNYHEVVDFLDQLTYGSTGTPGTYTIYQEWRQKIDETGKKWGDDKLRRR
jgi:ribosomal protein L37AE/L43A